MESLPLERVFTSSGLKRWTTVVQQQLGEVEKAGKVLLKKTLSINNFLKSQDQIDADFYFDRQSNLVYEELNNRDGYLNTNNPGRIDSGFMEENY